MYPPGSEAGNGASTTLKAAHEAVQEWEDYLSLLTAHTVVSPNCGFNQYLDFHPGIYPNAEGAAEGVGTLDDILYQFARDKVNFRIFHAWDKQHLYANASNSATSTHHALTGRAFQLIGTASNPGSGATRSPGPSAPVARPRATARPDGRDSGHLPEPPSTSTAGDVTDGIEAASPNASATAGAYVAPPSNTSTPI
ncbi:hypothetical protein JL720_316 [Aureococcus anophagefferens]|nr:hypothetical protein JL720_316 [Aureococcus anophagefferens]